MPTLIRINIDIGRDFSQNKRRLNVFVQSSMKRRNVDGENSLPSIIFRNLLSIAPISSVKSSSLRHVSVSGYSFRHWRAFQGAAFPKSSCFHKFCQVDYLIMHRCRVTSRRLSWPSDQYAYGGRGS
jgi:hypothetical protein